MPLPLVRGFSRIPFPVLSLLGLGVLEGASAPPSTEPKHWRPPYLIYRGTFYVWKRQKDGLLLTNFFYRDILIFDGTSHPVQITKVRYNTTAAYTNAVHAKLLHLRRKYKLEPNKVRERQLQNIVDRFNIVYPDYLDESRRIHRLWEKNRKRMQRIYRYVKHMATEFSERVYLVSLTFDDDTLERTSKDTRKDYVRRWLNANAFDYYACIDYGRRNGREHFHALAVFDIPLLEEKHKGKTWYKVPEAIEWKHGFYTIRKVQSDRKNVYKTINYALKASTYAFKASAVDDTAKPFHKRCVDYMRELTSDEELALPFWRLPYPLGISSERVLFFGIDKPINLCYNEASNKMCVCYT